MIEKRRQHRSKHLEDSNDENAHEDPLADVLGQGGLYDLAEAESEGGDDKGDDNRRPNHITFAELTFAYHIIYSIIS